MHRASTYIFLLFCTVPSVKEIIAKKTFLVL